MTESARTFCRVCQAQCGLVLDIDGGRIVRVNGDRDHAVSRGYTCSKGRALAQMHESADRVDQPYLEGALSTWDATLSDLSSRLTRLIEEHGPTSVACYRSSGWVFDTIGRMAVDRWVRAIGTNQLYSPATIDTPNRQLVPDLMAGAPFLQPIVDWEHTELLIVLGQNLVVSHGHATAVPDPVRRLRAVQARGGSIVVADPRITETAQLADLHLQLRPGTDAALAAYLVGCRLRGNTDDDFLDECADPGSIERLRDAVAPFDRERTADICDVSSRQLDAVASLLVAANRLSFVSGTGVSMGPAPNATEWLGWALGAVTGSLDRRGGMLFNAGVLRPETDTGPATAPRVSGPPPSTHPGLNHSYGEYPSAVLCDEILAGTVHAVVSFGGNIAASFPDSAKTAAALKALDVLAVSEVRHTQTTALATHVLPTCDQLERHDVTFFMDHAFPMPFAQYASPVFTPSGDRRQLWQVMADLAQRMGLDIGLDERSSEDTLLRGVIKRSRVPLDVLRAAPSGVVDPDVPRWNWLIPDLVPGGALNLAPEPLVQELAHWAADAGAPTADRPGAGLRLICRRLPHQMNSDLQDIPSQQRAPHPTLLMHPDDARAHGVPDGDTVTVATSSGTTEATVELTDRIRRGVVSLPHSWRSPSVNHLTTTEDLEPLTGMPRFTDIHVSVARRP